MSTSGTTSWSLPRDTIIGVALRKLGLIPSGGTPTTHQISDAGDSLNAILKAFAADGLSLWKINSQTFTVVSGTSTYTVGPSQTINCPKPLKITSAFWTPSGGNNTPLNVYTRYDFNQLPQGSSITGTPVDFYYQPGRVSGTIRLWPTPNDNTTLITFNYTSYYEDMLSSANDFDLPAEWMMAVITKLAWVMAPEYGIPLLERAALQKDADYWHAYALSAGGEEGSIFLQPDGRM